MRLRNGEYRDPYYIDQVVKELRKNSLFAHCRYTHLEC